ncbi:MAG: glucose-6-phosphate isomerase [Thalassobaculales bacterium]
MTTPLHRSPQWRALQGYARAMRRVRLADLFANDPRRAESFSMEVDELFADYSKTHLIGPLRDEMMMLAEATGVPERIEAMFAGQPINVSEGRAVLHVALRAGDRAEVVAERARLRDFVEAAHAGRLEGAAGRPLRQAVAIGIGGSELGPHLVSDALAPVQGGFPVRFVGNVDPADLAAGLAGLDPAETLLIVASKSFTTQETMANARAARAWLVAALGADAPARHIVALSTDKARCAEFGIPAERVFGFWDWVGGRYSVWSAIGLPAALAIGWPAFQGLLDGAAAMDRHFRSAPLPRNLPVLLGLLRVWYSNFQKAEAFAILPYSYRLRRFAAWLQQVDMESNGKGVGLDGRRLRWKSGPVVFGEPGTNAQHAFMQLVHQGTRLTPVDIIVPRRPLPEDAGADEDGRHRLLVANALAQAEALMRGRSLAEARRLLRADGVAPDRLAALAPHRAFPGNRPTTTILLPAVTPRALGLLMALYEHMTLVQGAVWGINSFDQFGVELGKTLADRIAPALAGAEPPETDGSTAALLARLR